MVITRDAAEFSTPLQQQGASSAGSGGSVILAEQLGLRKKQAGSASSRRFSLDQQAVAAALMVVLKRAMKDSKEAAIAAKQTLAANNPATSTLLKMLPDEGPLPTMQQVERKASKQLRESLAKLAKQCEAASCKPLEVFSRSVQCTTHKTGAPRIVKGRVTSRQQYLLKSKKPQLDSCFQGTVRTLRNFWECRRVWQNLS